MTSTRRTFQWISCVALLAAWGCGSGGSAGPGGSGGGSGGTGSPTGSGGTDTTGSGGASAGALTGDGCAGGKCQNPTCKALTTAMPMETYPNIGFEERPAYIPMDTIIPTFDDAPDGETDPMSTDYVIYGAGKWTQTIVDFLDSKDLHMDFFLNTDNWCGPVKEDIDCVKTIGNILRKHNPANHTVHHIHIGMDIAPDGNGTPQSCDGPTSGVSCDKEMADVESLVKAISLGGRPHLTRFRAPFGEPYQSGTEAQKTAAQAVVSKYAVHVGWHMDSDDSKDCLSTTGPCFTGKQIADNVITLIGTAPGKRYGVLLMHGTFPWTKDAVPMLFDPQTGYLAMHGFKLATVEDAICWKYGMHSWDIVKKMSGQDRGPN